jgi:hypothetical protein
MNGDGREQSKKNERLTGYRHMWRRQMPSLLKTAYRKKG